MTQKQKLPVRIRSKPVMNGRLLGHVFLIRDPDRTRVTLQSEGHGFDEVQNTFLDNGVLKTHNITGLFILTERDGTQVIFICEDEHVLRCSLSARDGPFYDAALELLRE